MSEKVLVTGAGGKTGQVVVTSLIDRGVDVRAWVKNEKQAQRIKNLGVEDTFIGDMEKLEDYSQAAENISSIYHICPNMHPREFEIGEVAVRAAQIAKISRFIYHSVLHPQTEKMPHHWNKLRVEELILESNLNYTIIQPGAYMQNILGNKEEIKNQGVYKVPYPEDTAISMVDIQDIAEVVATVITESGHNGAIYELVGSESIDQITVAKTISEVLEKTVQVEQQPLALIKKQFQEAGFDDYKQDTLIKMFTYYSYYGLHGNSNVLTWLLGRTPTSFADFVAREF